MPLLYSTLAPPPPPISLYFLVMPMYQGVVNDYRRFTGEAVRLAMTEFLELAGDKVKTLGFSWQVGIMRGENPNEPDGAVRTARRHDLKCQPRLLP